MFQATSKFQTISKFQATSKLQNILKGLLLVVLAGAVHAAPPAIRASTDWKEVIEPGEPKLFADFADEINKIQDNTAAQDNMPLARGFHIKTHSILTGEFKVADGLPEECRQGVFAKPGTYQTWIRFSNLKPQRLPDRNPDFRAIAVKILNVPGTPLTAGVNSLDLMALNHPIQPARNIHQFIAFVRYSFHLLTFPIKLAAAIGVMEATRMITWMTKNLGGAPSSLANQTYWSTIPIAWGKYAVKYKFEPQNGASPPINQNGGEHFLRDELGDRLKKGALTWDLYVQFYTDPQNTPIEDAVVEWLPEKAPFIKVGTLTIAQRDLTSVNAQAEETRGDKFLWNPWHAPEEHRPLGGLQRARRISYPASGKHRGMTQP